MTTARLQKFMPSGIPRYVRCYDNEGKTADRYTIVLTGRYRRSTRGSFLYLSASAAPFHPQGIGMHGEADKQIDRPVHSHLGKKIAFESLPADVQQFAKSTYTVLWNLK